MNDFSGKIEHMLIVGGSRGIGLAVAEYSHTRVKNLVCVSRTPSKFGRWIEADVADNRGIDRACKPFENQPLDALLYLGGTWEKNAFTSDYAFANSSDEEIDRVIAVNSIAPIKFTRRLIPSLQNHQSAKLFLSARLGVSTIKHRGKLPTRLLNSVCAGQRKPCNSNSNTLKSVLQLSIPATLPHLKCWMTLLQEGFPSKFPSP